jgi:hypothetical protein
LILSPLAELLKKRRRAFFGVHHLIWLRMTLISSFK